MGYRDYLIGLLRPLGVYDLRDGKRNTAELECFGTLLDECAALLEDTEREMLPLTAAGRGLDVVDGLLSLHPLADTVSERRTALSALLRVGGDSFTPAAINDSLAGCGVAAQAVETGTAGKVKVALPDGKIEGVPEHFAERKKILEELLPCHLLVLYDLTGTTWRRLEEAFPQWKELDGAGLLWGFFEA